MTTTLHSLAGSRVFITGHMGFKGAWLCALLSALGAQTVGYGFDRRARLLYPHLDLADHRSIEGDINDLPALQAALRDAAPDIVLHLAAQPLVLESYDDPVTTFETNVVGTVRVMEAVRHVAGIRALIVVTSDKVYRNDGQRRAFAESDALGGHDPYSGSKAAAELACASMAASFFADGATRVATARAGNVIGGGDWAQNRLLPDAARAFEKGEPLVLRHPEAVRPWQHVLDPLAGYLVLARHLLDGTPDEFGSWNFGPDDKDAMPVREVSTLFVASWGGNASVDVAGAGKDQPKEAGFLTVDSSKARAELDWQPTWRTREAVERTALWYRRSAGGTPQSRLVADEINDFLAAFGRDSAQR